MTEEGGIYIHIPFCRSKCLYCDFYSGGARQADWTKYAECLLSEMQARREELNFQPVTLYIGGGTPSLLPSGEFNRLIEGLSRFIDFTGIKEFTIEVNPEDVSPDSINLWKDLGVNRISMGLQTLNDQELKLIRRGHDANTGLKSLELLSHNFSNISVDVMYGFPGQTLSSYQKTLNDVLSFAPPHISSYSLMLEPGTAMTLLVTQNKLSLPTEEEWLRLYDHTIDSLIEHGYNRYEISNYSLPGYESLHNTGYWEGKPYIGLGPASHSYDGINIRRANTQDIKGYINYFSSKVKLEKPFYLEEKLTQTELKEEYIMTRLRMAKGIDLHKFSVLFGEREKNILLQKASSFKKNGLMEENKELIRFTREGFNVSDMILSDLI